MIHFLGPLVATAILMPAQTPAQRKIQEIRSVLAQEIDFPGFDDPKMTLEGGLLSLGKRYHLTIRVNEAAFKNEQVIDVLKTPIADPNPIPASKDIKLLADIRLDAYFRRVLGKVPAPSGAVYFVWPNGIEVTTEAALRAQNLVPEPPPSPSAAEIKRACAMRDTLVRPCQFSGFDDPRMTLQEALEFMAKRYELHFTVSEKAFKFDNVNEVLKTPIADPNPVPRPTGLILPGKVIEMLLAKIPVPSGAVFVIRPHGYIEITTRLFLMAELLGIDPQEAFGLYQFLAKSWGSPCNHVAWISPTSLRSSPSSISCTARATKSSASGTWRRFAIT